MVWVGGYVIGDAALVGEVGDVVAEDGGFDGLVGDAFGGGGVDGFDAATI